MIKVDVPKTTKLAVVDGFGRGEGVHLPPHPKSRPGDVIVAYLSITGRADIDLAAGWALISRQHTTDGLTKVAAYRVATGSGDAFGARWKMQQRYLLKLATHRPNA